MSDNINSAAARECVESARSYFKGSDVDRRQGKYMAAQSAALQREARLCSPARSFHRFGHRGNKFATALMLKGTLDYTPLLPNEPIKLDVLFIGAIFFPRIWGIKANAGTELWSVGEIP